MIRVLSPHLDDAVLSCGGAIAEWTRAGRSVEVWTLFCGDEPSGEPASDVVRMLHRVFDLPGGIVASRRREDEEAVGLVGATVRHDDLHEAIYRVDPENRVLYPSLQSLFARVDSSDEATVDAIVERLRSCGSGETWLAPLGVGRHVDHQIVRRAAEEAAAGVGATLELYEEVPYVLKWRALSRALPRRSGWTPRLARVGREALSRKIEAVARYRSQIGPLFGDASKMERRLRRLHRRRGGGERFWLR